MRLGPETLRWRLPTRNTVHYISGPDQHDSSDTSRKKVNLNSGRLKMEPGNGKARARSRRALGTRTGSRRSTKDKNGAFIRARGDMVHGEGGGNLTLIDLISTEGKRERIRGPVMHQVGPDIRWKTFAEGTTQEEASLMISRKKSKHLHH